MVTSSEVLEVIVVSMRDAFLAVTVFVAAMVLYSVGCSILQPESLLMQFEQISAGNLLLEPLWGSLQAAVEPLS